MDTWILACALAMFTPFALLSGASSLPQGEETLCRVDVEAGRRVEIDDLALEIALITAAHV